MNYVLLASLILLFLISFFCSSDKKLLSPGVLIVVVMIATTTLMILNQPKWNYQISPRTVMVVLAGVLCFIIGVWFMDQFFELESRALYESRGGFIEIQNKPTARYDIDLKWFILFTLISFAGVLWYFVHQYRLSVSLGNKDGILGMLAVLRPALTSNADYGKLNVFLMASVIFVRAFGFISIYIFLQKVLRKDKSGWLYLIPIMLLLIYYLLTTGRIGFLGVVTTVIFDLYHILFCCKEVKQKNTKKHVFRFVWIIVCVVIMFCVAFWVLGFTTGKAQGASLFSTISIYAGSSVVCLDGFVSGKIFVESGMFGSSTFRGVYNMIRYIVPSISVKSMHAPMYFWSGESSNVYTFLFPYLVDFGTGGLFLQLIIGAIFCVAWRRFSEANGSKALIFYYGKTFGYATAMFSIAESFCTELLSLNFFLELFFVVIISVFFIKPIDSRIMKLKKRKRNDGLK